jgi:hypothetical protein
MHLDCFLFGDGVFQPEGSKVFQNLKCDLVDTLDQYPLCCVTLEGMNAETRELKIQKYMLLRNPRSGGTFCIKYFVTEREIMSIIAKSSLHFVTDKKILRTQGEQPTHQKNQDGC